MVERVLVVVPDFPCPAISGSHLRDLQQISVLSDLGIKPHVFSFLSRDEAPAYDFEGLDGRVSGITTVRRAFPGGNAVRVRIARNMRYVFPPRADGRAYEKAVYPNAIPYDAADGGERVLDLIRRIRPDVVLLRSYFIHYLPMIRALGVKTIVDAHDCESFMAREMVRARRNPVLKATGMLAHWAVLRQERRYMPLCDELWETSSTEVARIRSSVGAAMARVNVFPLPSALDMPKYPLLASDPVDPNTILSVGSLFMPPNANAAARLMQEVFPRVRRRRKGATLHIVGSGAPVEIRRMAARTPGVVMVGFAPDLVPHYQRAAVAVVAVEEGHGILLKTLEAMAFGKALVSSVVGVDGTDVVEGEHALVARSPDDYADAICGLLDQASERRRLGLNARRLVEERYSWDAVKRTLRDRSGLFASQRALGESPCES